MKTFDIEEIFKNTWKKIDVFYRKVFVIFFLSLNIVFIYNSLFCLFGIHDIYSLFAKISPVETFYIGRFSVTWLEYFLSNKTVIPLFTNLILFFFLSLTVILMLRWFDVKKTLFNYLIPGLFVILAPCIYVILWYRTSCLGHLMTLFFLIVSFFVSQKANSESILYKRYLYLVIALFFMVILVFGAYPPIIGISFGFLITKIFLDILDNNFSNIKQILMKYKYVYLLLSSSLFISYIIFEQFKLCGLIREDDYNAKIIGLSEILEYFPNFLYKTLNSFFFDTFPYIGVSYKLLLVLFVLLSFITLIVYICLKTNNVSSFIKRILLVFFVFVVLFYSFNIVYFLSPIFYTEPRFLRLEYWTTIYFVFICIIITLKYCNTFTKNILLLLACLVIFMNVQINMHIQKDQMIMQQVELSRVMILKNLILSNKNYEYSDEIKYNFVRIGNLETSGYISLYNSNEFTNNYFCELYQTFLNAQSFLSVIVNIPQKITNINPYFENVINSPNEINKYLYNDNLREWLLYEAKVYPSFDCVFIDKGNIYVVMNKTLLTTIRTNLKENNYEL